MTRITIKVCPVRDAYGTVRYRAFLRRAGRSIYASATDYPIASLARSHADGKRAELKAGRSKA